MHARHGHARFPRLRSQRERGWTASPTQRRGYGSGIRLMSEMSAADWRGFWEERGMRELRLLLAESWPPLGAGTPRERDATAFRIGSLLGSRAPSGAIAEELGGGRGDVRLGGGAAAG